MAKYAVLCIHKRRRSIGRRPLVGGNCINYPGNKSTPTADLLMAKIFINSTISTPVTIFLGIDLENFSLNTPIPTREYMWLLLGIIPKIIIIKYNLRNLVDNKGCINIKNCNGMYSLPQWGILANQLLEKCLATDGYSQCQHTPRLWQHIQCNIIFCLVIDNFGIKVTNMANIHHLKEALEEHCRVTGDWKGSVFCSIKLTWDYVNHHSDTHMPGYIGKALKKYQCPHPTVPQHAPYNASHIQ
jgi:hypothetical protein